MADATAEFFDGLSRRGHEPLLGKLRATVRFDIVDGNRTDHWMLGLDDGDLECPDRTATPDCVIQADKAAFDKVASRPDERDGRLPPRRPDARRRAALLVR